MHRLVRRRDLRSHKDKKVESRIFFAIGAFFLVYAFDQAWQDEHRKVQTLIGEKAFLFGERDFWKNQSYEKDASLRTRDDLLTKNYGVLAETQSSLATLSNRMLDVAKPAPLKIDVMRWRIPETYTYANVGRVQFWVLVLISNKVKALRKARSHAMRPSVLSKRRFSLTETL